MARTVFPVEAESGVFSVTSASVSPEKDPALERMHSLDPGAGGQKPRKRSAEEQGYLERVQNYIPAEIVALFIFVNSLIVGPVLEVNAETGKGVVTAEGWVAVAALAICVVGCFIFARVAAKQADNPAYGLQGVMFTIAFLIWIYAIDAKVLAVFNVELLPALSGLLLVTFTVFSGLVVPRVKPVKPVKPAKPVKPVKPVKPGGPGGNDAGGNAGGKVDPAAPKPQQSPASGPAAAMAAPSGGRPMSENATHFCMCLRNKPGGAPLEGAERAAVLREAKWAPGTAISVMFLSGSAALQARVRAVAEEWVADGMANLSFNWVDDPEANIRIDFVQGDGSWSYLGTVCRQIPSPQATMNYGWLTDASSEEDLRRVVLHEFGHALGMIHEHQSPDGGIRWNEAAVIADLSGPPNNWDRATIDTNVLNKYDPDAVDSTAVDPTSIMMYPIPAAWTDDGFSAGLNGELSDLDRQLIREVYP